MNGHGSVKINNEGKWIVRQQNHIVEMELGILENNVIRMIKAKNDGEMEDVIMNVKQRHGVTQIIIDKG